MEKEATGYFLVFMQYSGIFLGLCLSTVIFSVKDSWMKCKIQVLIKLLKIKFIKFCKNKTNYLTFIII